MANKLEEQLGWIAMKFRGCLHQPDVKEQRYALAVEYAKVVFELIESGTWNEIPTMEEQLTDEYMPKSFFKYWGLAN